jgi:hypothetical protein
MAMDKPKDCSSSRRKWLGIAAGASIGSGLLAATGAIAEPPKRAATSESDLGARTYNIRDFGAKGDGTTLDTDAVQAAIDACTKDQGGTVLVPAGVFVIGTVELKSNVTLRLAASAKLLGTADGKQYRHADAIPLSGDSTLGDGNVGLIFAIKAENVTIEGHGTIDGQGAQFHSPARGVMPPAGISGDNRPYHLLFHQCTESDAARHFPERQRVPLRAHHRKHVREGRRPAHLQSRERQQRRLSLHQLPIRTREQLHGAIPGRRVRSFRQLQIHHHNQLHRSARAGRFSASAAAKRKTSSSPTA